MSDSRLIGQPVDAVDTPALIVDADVLTRNLLSLQRASEAAGLQVRPHIKAHKTPQIAQMQVRAGAVGVTAAKIGEAEVMADAGIEDIFIANILIGEAKLRRLVALARRVPKLSVAVDSLAGAEPLGAAFAAAGMSLDVMIEVDTGAGRCGVLPEQVAPFAREVAGVAGLRLVGIMAYAAGSYACRNEDERRACAAREGATLAALGDELRRDGHDIRRLSGGSTPTAGRYVAGNGLTEIRSGTYCLNDHNQVDLGTCTVADVAATVLATVISHPAPNRYITDAGTKALDQQVSQLTEGYGVLLDPPGARVVKINDEHGYLDAAAAGVRVGDKVRIIPPRICTCLNLYDEMIIVQEGIVRDVWRIAARGKNT
jgi:D-serine deaminase-like pyridoxal phosphate-dependent protein